MGRIRRYYYKIKTFFRNLKLFWKVLWTYHWWDYQYLIDANIVMLKDMAEHFEEKGTHVNHKHIASTIREIVELLETDIDNEAYEKFKHIKDYTERGRQENLMIDAHKDKIIKLLLGPNGIEHWWD